VNSPGDSSNPRPPSASRQQAQWERDGGLRRVSQVTRWTVAGGLALTGGFAFAGTGVHAIQRGVRAIHLPTHSEDRPSDDRRSDDERSDDRESPAPASAATANTGADQPPQPSATAPAYTPAPPIVASGGS